jgi:uncharacterized protein (DUF2141 family)
MKTLVSALVLLSLLSVTAEKLGQPKATCRHEGGYTISGIISGYAPGKGVYVALYDSQENFESQRYCRNLRFIGEKLPPDSLRYSFDELPAGEYLVASYQDEDGDGKMTKGFFGIPKEPYRIYRPNYGFFGPKFEKCKFRVDGDYAEAHLVYGK